MVVWPHPPKAEAFVYTEDGHVATNAKAEDVVAVEAESEAADAESDDSESDVAAAAASCGHG